MENVFYVYLHRRKTDNKVFYVGKGKGRRAYTKTSRSQWWKSVSDKHGLIVEVVFENLSEEEAFQIEKDTILEFKYFGYPLVNLTNGGEGMSGYKQPEEQRKRVSEKLQGRKMTLEQRCNMSTAAIQRVVDHNLRENYKGVGNPNADKNVYTFINTLTDEKFIGTRPAFCSMTGILPQTLKSLFKTNPRSKTCFGWKVIKENNDTKTEEKTEEH